MSSLCALARRPSPSSPIEVYHPSAPVWPLKAPHRRNEHSETSDDVQNSLSFTLLQVEREFGAQGSRPRVGPINVQDPPCIIWIRAESGYWERVGTMAKTDVGKGWERRYLAVNGLTPETEIQVLPEGEEPVGRTAYRFPTEPFLVARQLAP